MSSSSSVDLSVIQAREESYFAAYGSPVFACTLAQMPLLDVEFAENLALNVVSDREILANASRQGDIGTTSRAGLPDAHSRKEHGSVDFDKSAATLITIREIAEIYKKRHGIKFMVFASGKSAEEMLEILKSRVDRPTHLEWAEARSVMFKIFLRRIGEVSHKYDDAATTSDQASIVDAHALMKVLFKRHSIDAATVTATWGSSSPSHTPQEITWNETENGDDEDASSSTRHWRFGTASKLIATAFCLEYFAAHKIALTTTANSLLESVKSSFRIKDGDNITLDDLLFATSGGASSVRTTRPIVALRSSTQFSPAGTPLTNGHLLQGLVEINNNKNENDNNNDNEAGLMVCQHIIQCHIKDEDDKPLFEATSGFFRKCGVSEYLFYAGDQHIEDEESVESLAFGLRGTESIAKGFHTMLLHIVTAYHDVRGSGAISHDSARKLLFAFANNNKNDSDNLLLLRSVCNNKYIVINGTDNSNKNKYFALQCYDGADRGKGFVVSSTNDGFNAEFASRGCCQALVFRGFDFYESAAQAAKKEKIHDEIVTSSKQQRNLYTQNVLRFFSPSEPIPTGDKENRKLAEEFTTSRGEIAARFALLGHGANDASSSIFDAASLEYGADVVVTPAAAATFSTAQSEHQYISMGRRALNPRPPLSMYDGFLNNDHPRRETQKSEDFAISLHHPVALHRIEIDFSKFDDNDNNNSVADFIEIIGVCPKMVHQNQNSDINNNEIILVPKTAVKHFAGSVKVFEISSTALNHVQVETVVVKNYPGGGFNRIKCFAKRLFF